MSFKAMVKIRKNAEIIKFNSLICFKRFLHAEKLLSKCVLQRISFQKNFQNYSQNTLKIISSIKLQLNCLRIVWNFYVKALIDHLVNIFLNLSFLIFIRTSTLNLKNKYNLKPMILSFWVISMNYVFLFMKIMKKFEWFSKMTIGRVCTKSMCSININ